MLGGGGPILNCDPEQPHLLCPTVRSAHTFGVPLADEPVQGRNEEDSGEL